MTHPTALVTGASRGLGLALAAALHAGGWHLVLDARDGDRLAAAVAGLPFPDRVTAVPGDVADPAHRAALAAAVPAGLDLLVTNASELGPSPLPRLADLPLDAFERVLAVNTVAPLALVQLLLPALRRAGGRVLQLSSDAAVEAYAGWGGYGASKAALDQLSAVLAVEEPDLRVYAVDPGDMATDMHQAAFPGEDISDRPAPGTVVPALLRLVAGTLPSGRYRAAELAVAGCAGMTAPFTLPPGSEATAPPERRGLARDGVTLLAARPGALTTHRFRELPDLLAPGDVVVVNTSPTVPARLDAVRGDGTVTPVHVATTLDDGSWVVEVHRPDNTGPDLGVEPGSVLLLPGGVRLQVHAPFPVPGSRLWRAATEPATAAAAHLARYGTPIRYGYLARPVPLAALQNVYATPVGPQELGSAEMASAGRPFTDRVLVRLMTRGVTVLPLALHTGVSSPELREPPAPERFAVPAATARIVTAARAAGGRVVAVGTTVTRALESATGEDGATRPASGWTDLVLSPDRPARVVTGLVTGLHAPEASHLQLLAAVAGVELVDAAYRAAVTAHLLWHEFGDSMLFLP